MRLFRVRVGHAVVVLKLGKVPYLYVSRRELDGYSIEFVGI